MTYQNLCRHVLAAASGCAHQEEKENDDENSEDGSTTQNGLPTIDKKVLKLIGQHLRLFVSDGDAEEQPQ